jgi:ATP-binding cassette subfamily B protein
MASLRCGSRPGFGFVTVDGVDVRRLTLASPRVDGGRHAGQFSSTRRSWKTCATLETRADVEDAARRAQIHHVIAALPEGYETLVGERGYRFSAGERQRLAIARAILRDPRILILDDATSSLDSVAERQVQQAIAPLLAGRTSLIIAHRLATVRDADLIIVVDHGRIVERGTHEELLARAGLCAWLWHAQARSDRDGAVQELAEEPAYAGPRVSVAVRGGRQTDQIEREQGW